MAFSIATQPNSIVEQTRHAVDSALQFTGYSCKKISWDDVSRYQNCVSGVSCVGPNITDTYLKSKDGTSLYTVRSDNWNEKLGTVSASQVALLIGNCAQDQRLRSVTLRQFLDNPAGCGGGYAGIPMGVGLSHAAADDRVSVRFQTVFLPVVEDPTTGRGAMQFAAEAYNYQTRSDDDPRNLVLLATSQGLSVQAGGAGPRRLLLHSGAPPTTNEYWLETESSRHRVGGPQNESTAEREDALRRGKATSEVIGIHAMGTRFNVLMTIQVPLKQKPRASFGAAPSNLFGANATASFGAPSSGGFGAFGSAPLGLFGASAASKPIGAISNPIQEASSLPWPDQTPSNSQQNGLFGSPSMQSGAAGFGGGSSPTNVQTTAATFGSAIGAWEGKPGNPAADAAFAATIQGSGFGAAAAAGSSSGGLFGSGPTASLFGAGGWQPGRPVSSDPVSVFTPPARASAARVSRGDIHGKHTPGSAIARAVRDTAEHVTVTVVLYHAVAGGVPSADDARSAVADMNALYAACGISGRLAEEKFNFMKPALTSENMNTIFSTPVDTPFCIPPTHAPTSIAVEVREIVKRKCAQLETTPFLTVDALLELKLMAFGAITSVAARTTVQRKFDDIESRVRNGDGHAAKGMFFELTFLLQGAMSM